MFFPCFLALFPSLYQRFISRVLSVWYMLVDMLKYGLGKCAYFSNQSKQIKKFKILSRFLSLTLKEIRVYDFNQLKLDSNLILKLK